MTPATFLLFFPEFSSTDVTLVTAKLALASVRMGGPDTGVWGSYANPPAPGAFATWVPTIADEAQANLAAHLLETNPRGSPMAMAKDGDGRTTYLEEFERIRDAVCAGPIVAGGSPWGGPPPGASAPPALVFTGGLGTASVTNGSTAVTFALPQMLPAGTLLAFGAQPGGYYSVALPVIGATSATLATPFTGATTAATSWVHT